MCTVSWILSPGGYELFMNRDELRSRGPAQEPRVDSYEGISFLAPRDSDGGGSWIAVNASGLGLTLLNRYVDSSTVPPPASWRSRGLLVTDLATATHPDEVRHRLEREPLDSYRAFTLVVFFPGQQPQLHAWDRRRLALPRTAVAPLASSSFDPVGIEDARRRSWARFLGGRPPSRERCLDFHRSHGPERGPYSPCMHREDAATVSFSWIQVDSQAVRLAYAEGAPCRASIGEPLVLSRHELALCV